MDLLRRHYEGSDPDFEQLYQRYRPQAESWIARLAHHVDTEDVVEGAMVKVYEQRWTYQALHAPDAADGHAGRAHGHAHGDGNPGGLFDFSRGSNVEGWLRTIVKNSGLSALRRNKHLVGYVEHRDPRTSHNDAEGELLWEELLDKLTPRQARAVAGRAEDEGFAEIARDQHISTASAFNDFQKGAAKAREVIGGADPTHKK